MNDQTYTSVTLLLRLRDLNDKEAWDDFVQRYVPKIYAWCRRYGMQEADASDITQEVLGKCVSVLRRFEYDPSRGSFRGWLKTVTNNTLRDFVNSCDRPGRGPCQVSDQARHMAGVCVDRCSERAGRHRFRAVGDRHWSGVRC